MKWSILGGIAVLVVAIIALVSANTSVQHVATGHVSIVIHDRKPTQTLSQGRHLLYPKPDYVFQLSTSPTDPKTISFYATTSNEFECEVPITFAFQLENPELAARYILHYGGEDSGPEVDVFRGVSSHLMRSLKHYARARTHLEIEAIDRTEIENHLRFRPDYIFWDGTKITTLSAGEFYCWDPVAKAAETAQAEAEFAAKWQPGPIEAFEALGDCGAPDGAVHKTALSPMRVFTADNTPGDILGVEVYYRLNEAFEGENPDRFVERFVDTAVRNYLGRFTTQDFPEAKLCDGLLGPNGVNNSLEPRGLELIAINPDKVRYSLMQPTE